MTEPTDDQVVSRLRRALDELTADLDDGPSALLPDVGRPVAGHRRAWVGVAAVSLALVGGAAWALSSRVPDRADTAADPATNSDGGPATTDTVPSTTIDTAPSTTTDTAASTTTDTAATVPAFTITSARLVPEPIEPPTVGATDDGSQLASWRITGDGMDGFLFASIVPSGPGPAPGAASERLDPPVGTARLVWSTDTPDEFTVPWIEWDRPDGTIWTFQSQGLYSAVSSNDWIDLVFEAVPGSGLPIVIPDDRATMLSVGGGATSTSTTTYRSIDTGTVDLTVVDGALAPFSLVGATDVRDVTVAGRPGWLGTFADGHVEVVWRADDGWWGLLGISPDLADQADAILTNVVRIDGV